MIKHSVLAQLMNKQWLASCEARQPAGLGIWARSGLAAAPAPASFLVEGVLLKAASCPNSVTTSAGQQGNFV